MYIRLNKFRDGAVMKHAHIEDAGWDVYSRDGVLLSAGETRTVPIGFGIELPRGTAGFLMPRTSNSKLGLVVHSCPIDSGYTGEIFAILTNTSHNPLVITKDTAIAQLVIQTIQEVTWTRGPCNHLWDNKRDEAFYPRQKTPRLAGAFGSTNDPDTIRIVMEEEEREYGTCKKCTCGGLCAVTVEVDSDYVGE